MRTTTLLILILWFSPTFGQDLSKILFEIDSASVASHQFNFSEIAEKVSIKEKVDFYLDNVVLKDTNAVTYYTGLESAYKLNQLRSNIVKLYLTIDTAEINRNLHFLDIDKDGDTDCVYDMFI